MYRRGGTRKRGLFPLIDAILTCITVAIIVLALVPAYYRASMSFNLRELSLAIKHVYISKTCIRVSIYLPCKLHVLNQTWLYCGRILIGHYPNITILGKDIPPGIHDC